MSPPYHKHGWQYDGGVWVGLWMTSGPTGICAAGLTQCSAEEFAQLQALNRAYNDKFGFPFIIAVKGVERSALIARFSERLARDPDREFGEALRQIARIAYFRLETLLAECAGRPVPARRG